PRRDPRRRRARRGRRCVDPESGRNRVRGGEANPAQPLARSRRRMRRARVVEVEDPRASDHSSRFASLPPMATEAPRIGARNRRVLGIAGGVVVGLAALFVLASLVEHIWYSGAVLPGVRIDGAHIGGKKDADARAAIARLSAQLDATPIRAHAGTRRFAVDPHLLDFRVDADATIREARDAGRDTSPLQMVTDTVLRRFRPDVVHLVVHYDATRFQGLLDGWANAVATGLVEGGLRFDGTTVVPISPRPGRGLLRADAERSMQLMLNSGSRPDLDLPIGDVVPR